MSRELKKIEKQIAHLEEQAKKKAHGTQQSGSETGFLTKLAELYKLRSELKKEA